MYQLLLVTVVPPGRFDELGPRLRNLIGELSRASGAERAASAKQAIRAIQSYFEKNPPNPSLLADLNDVLRALAQEIEASTRSGSDTRPRSSLDAPPAPLGLGVSASGRSLLPPKLTAARDALNETIKAARRWR